MIIWWGQEIYNINLEVNIMLVVLKNKINSEEAILKGKLSLSTNVV